MRSAGQRMIGLCLLCCVSLVCWSASATCASSLAVSGSTPGRRQPEFRSLVGWWCRGCRRWMAVSRWWGRKKCCVVVLQRLPRGKCRVLRRESGPRTGFADRGRSFPAADRRSCGWATAAPSRREHHWLSDGLRDSVDLGNGRRGVIASLEPVAIESSPGIVCRLIWAWKALVAATGL